MNEMKRLRRHEATELEKKREFYNAKIDEMEKAQFAEKQVRFLCVCARWPHFLLGGLLRK